MGLVDDSRTQGTFTPPVEHMFLKEKAAWVELPLFDNAPKYDAFDAEFMGVLQSWEMAGKPKRTDLGL